MNKTAIVILNYNNYTDTINCVDSVLRHESFEDIKLFIVDNASSVEVYEKVKTHLQELQTDLLVADAANTDFPSKFPDVTYLRNQKNLGYGKGNNSALTLIENDPTVEYVMILNNDTLFVESVVPQLVFYLESRKDCGIVAPLLYERDLKTKDKECARREKNIFSFISMMPVGGHLSWVRKRAAKSYISLDGIREDSPIPTQLISGACFLMRKSEFKEIGYFDPATFLYFEEDIIWKKIKRRRQTAFLLPMAKVVHLGANTTSKSSSLFIRKCHIDSVSHYLKNYSSFNSLLVDIILLSIRFSYFLRTKFTDK